MDHFGPLIFVIIIVAWIWQGIRRMVAAAPEGATGTQAMLGPRRAIPARPPAPPPSAQRPIAAAAGSFRVPPRPPGPPVPDIAPAPEPRQGAVVNVLRNRSSLATAVVVAEILAPPVALR
ncbi:MAG TPA: hypothetical protein VE591_11935 [Candidatus Acidoferrum sp.]|nr:hypothetical protein [Candidatus Acidoferrum sp.]